MPALTPALPKPLRTKQTFAPQYSILESRTPPRPDQTSVVFTRSKRPRTVPSRGHGTRLRLEGCGLCWKPQRLALPYSPAYMACWWQETWRGEFVPASNTTAFDTDRIREISAVAKLTCRGLEMVSRRVGAIDEANYTPSRCQDLAESFIQRQATIDLFKLSASRFG